MRVRKQFAVALAVAAFAAVVAAPPGRAEVMPGGWIRENILTAKEISRLLDGPRVRILLIRCDDEAVDGTPLVTGALSNGCSSLVSVNGKSSKGHVVATGLTTHATLDEAARFLAGGALDDNVQSGVSKVVVSSANEFTTFTPGDNFGRALATVQSGTTTASAQCIGTRQKVAVACARAVARAQLAKATG